MSKKLFLYLIFIFPLSVFSQVIIPFAYWSCRLPSAVGTDSLNADFLGGTTANTTVSGTSVVLSAGQTTGTFTSRVFDLPGNCPTFSQWSSVSWLGSLPYGKLLPDFSGGSVQSESTANYSGLSSSTFMTGIMGSWHLQETATGTAAGGKDFSDSSGTGTHGTINGGITLNAVGKIGRAITFNGTTGFINMGTPANITGLGNFSISFWIYPNNISTLQMIMHRTDNDAQQGFWVAQSATGQIIFQVINATTDSITKSVNTLPLSTWTHIVITTDGSITSANSKIYFNGVQATYTGATNGSGVHTSAAAQTLYIGQQGGAGWTIGATNYLSARLQELSFMGRQLTAAEILEEYRRGVNRVKMQFRSCIMSNCSDLPPWIGTDGTSATFFTELNNNSIQSTWLGTVLTSFPLMVFSNFVSATIPNNRYFQYKATLETDNTTYLPDLKSVTIKRP